MHQRFAVLFVLRRTDVARADVCRVATYVCLAAKYVRESNAYASLSLVVLGLAKIRASDVTGGT